MSWRDHVKELSSIKVPILNGDLHVGNDADAVEIRYGRFELAMTPEQAVNLASVLFQHAGQLLLERVEPAEGSDETPTDR